MRKIRDSLIALAILGGPASIILAHQKLTEPSPQEAFSPFDITTIVQQAYSRCSEAPQLARPSQRDDYMRSFDQCAARKNGCDPRSVYEVFLNLTSSPTQPEDQPPTRPL